MTHSGNIWKSNAYDVEIISPYIKAEDKWYTITSGTHFWIENIQIPIMYSLVGSC